MEALTNHRYRKYVRVGSFCVTSRASLKGFALAASFRLELRAQNTHAMEDPTVRRSLRQRAYRILLP